MTDWPTLCACCPSCPLLSGTVSRVARIMTNTMLSKTAGKIIFLRHLGAECSAPGPWRALFVSAGITVGKLTVVKGEGARRVAVIGGVTGAGRPPVTGLAGNGGTLSRSDSRNIHILILR